MHQERPIGKQVFIKILFFITLMPFGFPGMAGPFDEQEDMTVKTTVPATSFSGTDKTLYQRELNAFFPLEGWPRNKWRVAFRQIFSISEIEKLGESGVQNRLKTIRNHLCEQKKGREANPGTDTELKRTHRDRYGLRVVEALQTAPFYLWLQYHPNTLAFMKKMFTSILPDEPEDWFNHRHAMTISIEHYPRECRLPNILHAIEHYAPKKLGPIYWEELYRDTLTPGLLLFYQQTISALL